MEDVAPDFIEHDPRIEGGNREGLKKEYANRDPAAFKSMTGIERFFESGDYVIVHHLRLIFGKADRVVIDIFHVKDGLIAEHWDALQELKPSDGKNPYPVF